MGNNEKKSFAFISYFPSSVLEQIAASNWKNTFRHKMGEKLTPNDKIV